MTAIEWVGSIVLFAGATFVCLVTKLSLTSLTYLNNLAKKRLHQSTHDSLTQLANRKFFKQQIQQRDKQTGKKGYSVLLMDLDKFKLVNDLLGHHVGDLLLIEVAQRLRVIIANDCFLCRLGGDEFAIIVEGNAQDRLTALSKSIVARLKEPFEINAREINIGASIGIACFPKDGKSGGQLLKRADISMYQAKKNQAGYAFYNVRFETDLAKISYQIKALKDAVAENQLHLYYQPIINSLSGKVSAVEALSRWTLEDGREISPYDFIAMAQENNLMQSITAQVLESSLSQLHIWHKQQILINMHVNLSATDFQDPELVNRIDALLTKHAIKPAYLTLEITESTLIEDSVVTYKNIDGLRNKGVNIAIDDFGMAFSSLNYLRVWDINHIKLDYNFVKKILTHDKDLSIIEFSIALARKLNCTVTAEGVETEQLNNKLVSLGCDQLQGYWLCEPMSAKLLTLWFLNR